MATATVNSSGRGSIRTGAHAAWYDTRWAVSGLVQTTTVSSQIDVGNRVIIARAGNQYYLGRTYYWYDTSAYAGSITGITLNFFTGNNNGIGDIVVCESFAFANATTTVLAATDFEIEAKWDPANTLCSPVPFTANTGMSFALNSNAVTLANTGALNLVIVEKDHDLDDVSPGTSSYWGSIAVGSASSITVTYNAWGHDINNVSNADIAQVNNVNLANITTVNNS